ncbi:MULTISPECIES: hypothetical protein [Paenibacillus]|uniref:hypothetical protein n=1 Tax=Paenibacillus TaxID=44249 RepID=UPI00046646BD|nr:MULTISPECIES: hypothetical protein [Paenibacillus]KGP78093.1 hypothetical protein P364_0130000 [Paenibacillus sp. MAEPY2]KGP89385.1 hypothetical protein P363_0101650 [Paenibacillus sp. MAEPY1]OZQ71062.1 hypothetical protein CA599_11035 [Paenibacillus taichungensis]
MRKTDAQRGKAAVLKLKEDEEQLVLDWINAQSVYADSMRYLIQKEIAENGIRNLQLYIPRIRDIETIKTLLPSDSVRPTTMSAPTSAVKSYEEKPTEVIVKKETNSTTRDQIPPLSVPLHPGVTIGETENKSDLGSRLVSDSNVSIVKSESVTDTQSTSKPANPSPGRKAKKTFDQSTISSYQ